MGVLPGASLVSPIGLDPNFARTHLDLGNAYDRVGRLDEAIAEFQKSREHGGDNWPEMLIPVQQAYEKGGYRGYYRTQIELLKKHSPPVIPDVIAYVYLMLGDENQAIAILEKASKEKPDDLIFLRNAPRYDSVSTRASPRYSTGSTPQSPK